jgi:hypothetical protein
MEAKLESDNNKNKKDQSIPHTWRWQSHGECMNPLLSFELWWWCPCFWTWSPSPAPSPMQTKTSWPLRYLWMAPSYPCGTYLMESIWESYCWSCIKARLCKALHHSGAHGPGPMITRLTCPNNDLSKVGGWEEGLWSCISVRLYEEQHRACMHMGYWEGL